MQLKLLLLINTNEIKIINAYNSKKIFIICIKKIKPADAGFIFNVV